MNADSKDAIQDAGSLEEECTRSSWGCIWSHLPMLTPMRGSMVCLWTERPLLLNKEAKNSLTDLLDREETDDDRLNPLVGCGEEREENIHVEFIWLSGLIDNYLGVDWEMREGHADDNDDEDDFEKHRQSHSAERMEWLKKREEIREECASIDVSSYFLSDLGQRILELFYWLSDATWTSMSSTTSKYAFSVMTGVALFTLATRVNISTEIKRHELSLKLSLSRGRGYYWWAVVFPEATESAGDRHLVYNDDDETPSLDQRERSSYLITLYVVTFIREAFFLSLPP